ncbi:MAG: pyrroloquinoline quinone biosynthesis peptide chaperone PqqD [Gemmatimonadota bacterium]
MPVTLTSRPRLWRLARLDFDRVRQRPVLLYPEGAMILNETGKAILELCDGERSVAEISNILGTRYGTDVTFDVIEYLGMLVQRDLVTIGAWAIASPSEPASHA